MATSSTAMAEIERERILKRKRLGMCSFDGGGEGLRNGGWIIVALEGRSSVIAMGRNWGEVNLYVLMMIALPLDSDAAKLSKGDLSLLLND